MDAFKILCTFSVVFCATINAVPIKKYDQRQDGDLNIQAHLDKIVLLIIPSKNINVLDIKGQGQFDNYEDLFPLLGGKDSLNDFKYKSAADLDKEKKTDVVEIKEEKKDEKKTDKHEQKDVKIDSKKPADISPKKVEIERPVLEPQKRPAPKSDGNGRTYQTVHSANNRERVIAINPEDIKKDVPNNATKIEKL